MPLPLCIIHPTLHTHAAKYHRLGNEHYRNSKHRSSTGLHVQAQGSTPWKPSVIRWHNVPCTPGLLQGCWIQKRRYKLPSRGERPQLLDPWYYTSRSRKAHLKCKGLGRIPKALFGVSFPVPASPSGQRRATAEHTKLEILSWQQKV